VATSIFFAEISGRKARGNSFGLIRQICVAAICSAHHHDILSVDSGRPTPPVNIAPSVDQSFQFNPVYPGFGLINDSYIDY
jgi:hypothetical protein